MKKPRWAIPVASACLVMVAMGGLALASSTSGTSSDPLVSLSYLTDIFAPSVLADVDDMVAEEQASLEAQLETVAQAYIDQIEAMAESQGTNSADEMESYQVVTVTAGQSLILSEGGEVLLRSGTGTCVSSSNPGLVDMTDGTTLAGGGTLVANHLYLSTIDGRGVYASTALTVLVRGDYTIQ